MSNLNNSVMAIATAVLSLATIFLAIFTCKMAKATEKMFAATEDTKNALIALSESTTKTAEHIENIAGVQQTDSLSRGYRKMNIKTLFFS